MGLRIQILGIAIAWSFICANVAAQAYPSRALRLIVPAAPGGPLEAVVRPLAEAMTANMGQPFVIDNRPGANGIIGMEACARAVPDGYALCASTIAMISVNPWLYAKLPYQPKRDLAPIAPLVAIEDVVVATSNTAFASFDEMINAARSRPGTLNWGSPGIGSIPHLRLGAIRQWKNVDIAHVPYNTAPAVVQALLAGDVQLTVLAAGSVLPQIRAGKLRALATGSRILANVPTMRELGMDLNVESWFGLFAPAATPSEAIARLNLEARRVLSSDAFRSKVLEPQGFRLLDETPAGFAAMLSQERASLGRIIRSSGIKVE